MGDVGFVQSSDSALGHIVVLRVDNIEFNAGVDLGLNDLLGCLRVPLSGLLGHKAPVVIGFYHVVQSAGTSLLSSGTHNTLDVDDLVFIQALACQPFNRCLAFLVHVGNDTCCIEVFTGVDGTVEEDNIDAFILRVLQYGIPAGCICCGKEEIVNAVLDELLGGSDLLVVLQGISERSVIAVLFREHGLQVFVVGGTVAGFVGIVVDDTDFDQVTAGFLRFCGGFRRGLV